MSCKFCNKNTFKGSFKKCIQCGRSCCESCSSQYVENKCPCCLQGVTSDQFIMANNKYSEKCDKCYSICLPRSTKEIKKDAYDLKDYLLSICRGTIALLFSFGSANNGIILPPNLNNIDPGPSDTGHGLPCKKYIHYTNEFECPKCNNKFNRNTKELRLLSLR